jgi:hypothetical protein
MGRSTLLVAVTVLAVAITVAGLAWLPPGRVALGTACAAGLVLMSLHRRRSLMELAP